MAYERFDENPLNYEFCRYGASKLLFRGPKKNLKKPYNAFIGGTETFGKYLPSPFVQLVEDDSGVQAINFGTMNAGVDAFLKDPSVLDVCSNAKTTVVQVMGAQNMSNRLYTVHPRRNDRFLQASTLLKTIYREVDFTEFSFTRHMLMTLRSISEEKFAIVETELRAAWLARMEHLVRNISGRIVLLTFKDQRATPGGETPALGADPLYVDDAMVEQLRSKVSAIVQIDVTDDLVPNSTVGMCFPSLEHNAAAAQPGPDFHAHVAEKLKAVL